MRIRDKTNRVSQGEIIRIRENPVQINTLCVRLKLILSNCTMAKYYDEEYRDAICYTDPATEKFDRDGDGVVCYGEYFNLKGWDKDRGFGKDAI